jgi:hypothetical protein
VPVEEPGRRVEVGSTDRSSIVLRFDPVPDPLWLPAVLWVDDVYEIWIGHQGRYRTVGRDPLGQLDRWVQAGTRIGLVRLHLR